jgi:endonuclease/exonuclease/phosphatase family metal-dependent hydrolase
MEMSPRLAARQPRRRRRDSAQRAALHVAKSLALAAALAMALSACMVRSRPPDVSVELTTAMTRVTPGTADRVATTLPSRLRIATFNVHRETAANVIRGVQSEPVLREADLILLEEIHRIEPSADPCSPACALAKQLGMYAAYAPGHMQGDGSDGVAILSRAPILSTEVLELPDIDVHINSGRRVALVATVLVDGQPVTVYAVHLTNRLTVAERRRQMLPILEHASHVTTPVLMAGDFNSSPFSWFHGIVPIPFAHQDRHLEKLMRDYEFETPVARSGPTSRVLGMKLDAIYTRGFATSAFATAHASDVSDHLALWADVELRRQHSVALAD